jgi:hypothetical protein
MKLLIYTFLILTMTGCYSPQHFSIDARKDTIIVVKREISDRVFMTVGISGEIEDSCLVILYSNYKDKSGYVSKREYMLKKGVVKDTLGKSDLYDNKAIIEFKHQNNNSGNLDLEVMF